MGKGKVLRTKIERTWPLLTSTLDPLPVSPLRVYTVIEAPMHTVASDANVFATIGELNTFLSQANVTALVNRQES